MTDQEYKTWLQGIVAEAASGVAKAWRERMRLTQDQLSELTGFSQSAIYWFERGRMAPSTSRKNPRKMNPYSWQRYRRACHSVSIELGGGPSFNW